jgi:hypothetical protein
MPRGKYRLGWYPSFLFDFSPDVLETSQWCGPRFWAMEHKAQQWLSSYCSGDTVNSGLTYEAAYNSYVG